MDNRTVFIERDSGYYIYMAFALWPGEYGLDFETLPLPILVICGYPLRRKGLDVVDANDVSDRVNTTHRHMASVAALWL